MVVVIPFMLFAKPCCFRKSPPDDEDEIQEVQMGENMMDMQEPDEMMAMMMSDGDDAR